MLLRTVLYTAIICILLTPRVFATDFGWDIIIQDFEKDLRKEIVLLSPIEILSMSELSVDGFDYDDNIFGRYPNDKINGPPYFIERPTDRMFTKFLNYSIDRARLSSIAARYNKYTQIHINFNVEDSTETSYAKEDLGVETDFINFSMPQKRGSRIGLKLDPKGISSFREIVNPYLFLEHSYSSFRGKIKYSAFDGLRIQIEKNTLAPNVFSITSEYREYDNKLNFGASYWINEDWRIKLSTYYSFDDDNERNIFLALFTPIKF